MFFLSNKNSEVFSWNSYNYSVRFSNNLSTINNSDSITRFFTITRCVFDFIKEFNIFGNSTEYDVLAIKPISILKCNEKLTAISVWTAVCHRKQTSFGVFSLEGFVFEFLTIDGFSSSSIFMSEITTLEHEILDETMENGVLIVERLALRTNPLLTSAESTEILCRFGCNVFVEFHFDSLGLFISHFYVEEYLWIMGIRKLCNGMLLLLIVDTLFEESTPHLLLFLRLLLFSFSQVLQTRNHLSVLAI